MEVEETATVLRNQGAPIRLARLDEAGNLVYVAGVLQTDPAFVRFDANSIAEIEEAFDGIEGEVAIVEREPMMDPKTGEPVRDAGGAKVIVEKEVGQEMRPHYGAAAFSLAMSQKPGATLRDAIAIALYDLDWREHRREIGKRLLPEDYPMNQAAVGAAWAMAQGVDPTDAAKILREAEAIVAAVTEEVGRSLDEMKGGRTGDPSSEPGSETVGTSTASGD